jgi:hypothetical protein
MYWADKNVGEQLMIKRNHNRYRYCIIEFLSINSIKSK